MGSALQPFIWYDVMAPDMGLAARFYSAVMGWRAADAGVAGMEYSILWAGETRIGGIMPVPPGFVLPPMWTGYIFSNDVDGDARRAEERGGTIFQEPLDIPGVGRFAVLADSGGALFNIFRPESSAAARPAAASALGHVGWHDLRAANGEEAWEFYSGLFGWVATDAFEAMPGATYQMSSLATSRQAA
ncbi:MAG: VOC family protein [Alphaproteobacteria bacterium]|nr:VOC family protein [Alphaproteobacteria bacterium]